MDMKEIIQRNNERRLLRAALPGGWWRAGLAGDHQHILTAIYAELASKETPGISPVFICDVIPPYAVDDGAAWDRRVPILNFLEDAYNSDPSTDIDMLIARVRELEGEAEGARDRFYIEAAGHQCWRCFQEIPHEWQADERFHVTNHPLAGTKRYPCEAGGIWLALRLTPPPPAR